MDGWHKGLGGLLILALIYILFLQQCGGGQRCPEITKIDTVLNVTVYDTTWFDTTRYKYLTVKIPMPYYDTVRVPIPTGNYFNEFDQEDDFVLKYPAIYEDSITNDTISIYYRAKVRGYLDEFKLGYKIYAPYSIEKLTIVQTEITREKRFNGFYIGLDVGGNKTSFSHFAPMLEVATRKYNYNVGYNLMDQSLIVGMRARLRFKRKQD